MAAADLVVARSGGSVAELAALGKPAILVPYPHATADHQRKNAREMVAGGAALLVDDARLTGDVLARMVRDLLGNRERLAIMAAASAALGRPDAAQRVADQVEDVVTSARRGAR
jgi:UDP-N-acetylglucosamine--N-acetylmuramyl-(pentapeptide) pyrophosphoryl-undecaprenol N-acetylglucosamine transferase